MNFIIYFLLISSLSILIGESSPVVEIKNDVRRFIHTGGAGISNHVLKLNRDGLLGETKLSLVWQGTYNGVTDVAIKINTDEIGYNDEMRGFEALNATDDVNIESHGIPRVYYSGKFMFKYYAIAMTLFNETLADRVCKEWEQNRNISELSILLIFRRVVEILQYLTEKEVVHNDIKPGNIFLRGSDAFLSDFNAASRPGEDSEGVTKHFASSNYYLKRTRHARDDLESLVFSLWFVAGIPRDKKRIIMSRKFIHEGKTLAKCKQKGAAREKMLEKCMQFKDPIVQEAFRRICVEEMLKHGTPNHTLIVEILTNAITAVHGNSGTPRFEWLTGESSSAA